MKAFIINVTVIVIIVITVIMILIISVQVATFKDGSTAEVDVIMMCTGYLHSYPFLRFTILTILINAVVVIVHNREDLRMKSKNLLYPAGMYKGMVWTAGICKSFSYSKYNLPNEKNIIRRKSLPY